MLNPHSRVHVNKELLNMGDHGYHQASNTGMAVTMFTLNHYEPLILIWSTTVYKK